MDYENASDFEINKRVAECQSLIVNEAQDSALKVKSSGVLVNCITAEWEFNPCHKASDAWPIIVENNISIELRNKKPALAYVKGDAPYDDKNPLRAAMIVYLMMQEAKCSANQ